MFAVLLATISYSKTSSSREQVPSLIVASHIKLSAAWFLTSALSAVSKSNPNSLERHRASLSVESARLRIHFSVTWLVRMVNR